MEKITIILTVVIVLIVFGLAGFGIYTNASYGEKEGEVIDKEYHRAYTTTSYETVTTGNTSISIPVQKYYPESYQVKIQKEVDEELKQRWIEVTAQEYENIKIGDWYGR